MCDFLNNIVYNRIRFEHTVEYWPQTEDWPKRAVLTTLDKKTGDTAESTLYHVSGKAWTYFTPPYQNKEWLMESLRPLHTLLNSRKFGHRDYLKRAEKSEKLKREV